MRTPYNVLNNGWSQIIVNLPSNLDLEKSAKESGALVRMRQVKSARDLLHLIFAYVFCHMSFRETAAWAIFSNIAAISDVALLKRFKNSLPWLKFILHVCLQNKSQSYTICLPAPLKQIRLIDATYVNSLGSHSSQWRIHTSYNPHNFSFNFFKITDSHGAETLEHFPLTEEDLVIADRGYAKSKQIRYLVNKKIHYIIRTGYQTCSLRNQNGTKFNLMEHLIGAREGRTISTKVYIGNRETKPSDLTLSRLIIIRKQPEAIQRAIKRSCRKASRQCYKPSAINLEVAEYFMILTSLPEELFDMEQILSLYRIRWQIEIAFKRLKSLIHINKFRVRDPLLIQGCLCVGLIIALLIDKIFPIIYKFLSNNSYKNRAPSLWRLYSLLRQHFYCSIMDYSFKNYWLENLLLAKRNLYEPPRRRQLKSLEIVTF